MAGGFAHITAAAEALGRLGEVTGLTPADKMSISQFMPFVEVGAVGPDYPYLGGQSEWADNMHYRNTGEVIRNGVRVLRGYDAGGARNRCVAWLLGYATHVATDLTIHPIVQARVGPYAENKTAHRACEMNQDAYIWKRRNLGEIGLADYFRINIGHCSNEDGGLHTDVAGLWRQMLDMTYPELVQTTPPDFDGWNKGFRRIVDIVDDAGAFFSFTRHLLASQGAVYPSSDGVDLSYIENLQTPEGPKHYDEVFDRAVGSIVTLWSHIGTGIHAQTSEELDQVLGKIPDGDLDTGVTLADDQLIFWSAA